MVMILPPWRAYPCWPRLRSLAANDVHSVNGDPWPSGVPTLAGPGFARSLAALRASASTPLSDPTLLTPGIGVARSLARSNSSGATGHTTGNGSTRIN